MTEAQFHRSRFTQIASWESFQRIQCRVLKAQTLPGTPMGVCDYFSKSRGANLLTRLILFWLKQYFLCAYRNSSQGTARKARNGQITYTPGSKHAKGAGDIFAVIDGRPVFVEIKVGRDILSPAQERFKANVTKSEGAYLVARSFDNFLEQYNHIISTS